MPGPGLCVLVGYNNSAVGDVVLVHHGVPGPGSAIKGSKALYSVSCTEGAGCVAVGSPADDVGTLVVTLDAAGAITSSRVITVPSGVTLSRIACVSVKDCVLGGNDIFVSPPALEVGHWNGTALVLHQVKGPTGTSIPSIQGVSCSGTACLLVGYADKGATSEGIAITTAGGQPTGLHTVPGDSIYGVSCATETLCYGAGFARSGGIVLTIHNGVAGAVAHAPGDLLSIACHSSSCTAVGSVFPPASAHSKAAFYGLVANVSSGKIVSTQSVALSGGFDSVARAGSAFAAVGSTQVLGDSEVTTGT